MNGIPEAQMSESAQGVSHITGTEKSVQTNRSITHGMTDTRVYRIWTFMKTRCLNKNSKSYKNYGGRGINICDEWIESFENFYRDMGDPPVGMQIERIDNNKGYFKENCKWATSEEQGNNKRNNLIIEYNGKSLTASKWSKITGIPVKLIYSRARSGWNSENIFNIPAGEGHNNFISFNGVTKTQQEWSLSIGGNKKLVNIRLRRGWSVKRALSTRAGCYGNN